MAETFIQKKQKLEFKDLVLQHLKKILEITTSEFKGGYYKESVINNILTKEYIPDTRKQYIQSIESLSDILLPHFDQKIKEPYKTISEKIKKLTEGMKKKKKLTDLEIRDYTLDKLEFCRELFRELNLLLKRKDYLKGSIYDETGLVDTDEETQP